MLMSRSISSRFCSRLFTVAMILCTHTKQSFSTSTATDKNAYYVNPQVLVNMLIMSIHRFLINMLTTSLFSSSQGHHVETCQGTSHLLTGCLKVITALLEIHSLCGIMSSKVLRTNISGYRNHLCDYSMT